VVADVSVSTESPPKSVSSNDPIKVTSWVYVEVVVVPVGSRSPVMISFPFNLEAT